MSQAHTVYRPDIDGLRAVAVLLVVFYHFGLGCCGGFCGVDVFFVISGYLITQLLTKDFGLNQFSYWTFCERRVRRLGPALAINAFVIAILSYLYLPPSYLSELGMSLVATPGAWTNILFWRTVMGGYFGDNLEFRPTLHYWSLAVEEQFYFLYPAFLGLFFRRRFVISGLAAIAICSYALSIILTPSHHMMAFFLLPTRAWELALGGLLTALKVPVHMRPPLLACGISLVLYSGFCGSPETDFPGWRAAVPCLGAACIILGNKGPSILTLYPLVAIGRLSYSMYLWHWPLYSFTWCCQGKLGLLERWALCVLLLPISALSYRYIEVPVRERRLLANSKSLFLAALAASACMMLLGTHYSVNDGLPTRFSRQTASAFEARNDRSHILDLSYTQIKQRQFGPLGRPGSPTKFILWGDSHAISVAPALDLAAVRLGLGGLQVTRSTTPPLLVPLASQDPGGARATTEVGESVVSILKESHPRYVLMAARWELYKGQDFNKCFAQTIKELKRLGAEPIIILDIPNLPTDPITALTQGDDDDPLSTCRVSTQEHRESQQRIVQAAAAQLPNKLIVDPSLEFFSPKGLNIIVLDGRCLYRDADHLTTWGARQLVPKFTTLLKNLASPEQPVSKR